MKNSLVEGDTVVVKDGKIKEVGQRPNKLYAHVAMGDTPRQLTINFIESGLHSGVTRMISAGKSHSGQA